jgi:ribosome maturation factor RimP
MPPDDASSVVASEVEAAVRDGHPELEVWDVVVVPRQGILRVLIDREGGVDLAACEAVTRTLVEFRERWALEVSSPGLERALTRPAHFDRVVGDTVRMKLTSPVAGRTNVIGRLAEAGPEHLVVDVDGERLEVPREVVGKSHVVWNPVKAQ